MDDFFSEVLIKRKMTAGNRLLQALPFCAGVLLILCGLFVHPLLLLPGVVLLGLGVFLAPRQEIEYEYAYVNGSLDIDCIFGKKSRKHLASYDLSQMEVMAQEGSPFLDTVSQNRLRTVDYTSGQETGGDPVYAVILPHGGERLKLLLQPSASMKKDLRMRMPSKVRL